MDIPENFFGVGGEEDITVQTVTWPDMELLLPQNVTEGEARGSAILTAKPELDTSPKAPETEEPLTLVPYTGASAFPSAENRTEGAATAFTSEDLVVQVTAAPSVTVVPGQPRSPGGKSFHWGCPWGPGGSIFTCFSAVKWEGGTLQPHEVL